MLRIPSPLSLAGLSAALLMFALYASWAHADASGPRMALSVSGDGVSCDGPAQCSVPSGGTFTLAVDVVQAPEPGYAGFQTEVYYGGLIYAPQSPQGEVLWPQSASPVRFPLLPDGQEGLIAHGDVSSLSPPFPASVHTGPVVVLAFACPPGSQTFQVALLPYNADSRLLGSGFKESAPDGGLAATVPAKGAGQLSLDIDGDTTAEAVDIAAAVTVECGNAEPTPTFTQTPTPAPIGDANCDGSVNSIDAALVLQFIAGFIDSLACAAEADANLSGLVDAIDAALILQFDAAIIGALPP